jgi:hypothetical protein
MGSNAEDLINRLSIYSKIHESHDKDTFLGDINTLKNDQIYCNNIATQKLFKNTKIAKLCNEFNFDNLNVLIGGSTAMSAVYKAANFIPNDLDLYIKNVSHDKLCKIETAIKKVFNDCCIIAIRNVITITWIVYKNNNIVYQIQMNILKINSWAEIFTTYHSDITCMGYDVSRCCFVYLKGRWENILEKNRIHYFCNILNCDTPKSLNRAVEKYIGRGFLCKSMYIGEDPINKMTLNKLVPHGRYDGYRMSISTSDPDSENIDLDMQVNIKNEIIKYLLNKYYRIENIFYSTSVKYLFPDTFVPLGIDFWKLGKPGNDNDFLMRPSTIKLHCKNENNCNCDNTCPIEMEHHNVFVKNKDCSHKLSLRTYIYNPIDKCPICRSNFIGHELVSYN